MFQKNIYKALQTRMCLECLLKFGHFDTQMQKCKVNIKFKQTDKETNKKVKQLQYIKLGL